jgi:curli biogenesis system outer membrane secretion channel CsgG
MTRIVLSSLLATAALLSVTAVGAASAKPTAGSPADSYDAPLAASVTPSIAAAEQDGADRRIKTAYTLIELLPPRGRSTSGQRGLKLKGNRNPKVLMRRYTAPGK